MEQFHHEIDFLIKLSWVCSQTKCKTHCIGNKAKEQEKNQHQEKYGMTARFCFAHKFKLLEVFVGNVSREDKSCDYSLIKLSWI